MFYCVGNAQGDGAGSGVAEAVYVDHDLGIVHAEAFLHAANDAQIGLMRDDQSQILAGEAVAFEDFDGELAHATHGVFEDLRAFLMDEVHAVVYGLLRSGMQGAAAGHIEIAAAGTVHVMNKIQDPFGVRGRGLDEYSAGAIAEENARGAVGVIENGSHYVTADDQCFLVGAAGDELRADGEGVEEAGAGGGKIKAPGIFRADAILDEAGGGGEKHVWSDGGDDDEADVVWADASGGENFAGSFGAEMGRGYSGVSVMALANSGACANPFVAGVDSLFEIEIRDHARRNVSGHSGDFCSDASAHAIPPGRIENTKLKSVAGDCMQFAAGGQEIVASGSFRLGTESCEGLQAQFEFGAMETEKCRSEYRRDAEGAEKCRGIPATLLTSWQDGAKQAASLPTTAYGSVRYSDREIGVPRPRRREQWAFP